MGQLLQTSKQPQPINYITITLHHRRKQRKSWTSQAMSCVQATIYLSHQMDEFIPTILHHNKGIQKHVLVGAETLQRQDRNINIFQQAQKPYNDKRKAQKNVLTGSKTLQGKKGIETSFSRHKNLLKLMFATLMQKSWPKNQKKLQLARCDQQIIQSRYMKTNCKSHY